jgi:NitT/TauT family transport system ATP-binding protein
VPTIYPKSSPSQVMGLLVLLSTHKGAEDVALLADDLDLEIDEILPSLDFAKALGFLSVADGRATLTALGKKMLAVNIRERKAILRDQLRTTTLFKTLIGMLERAPDHKLTEEEMVRLIAFTTAPADEAVQNIINWGRFAGLFRYDSESRILTATRVPRAVRASATGPRAPPPGGAIEVSPIGKRLPPSSSEAREQSMAPAPGVT